MIVSKHCKHGSPGPREAWIHKEATSSAERSKPAVAWPPKAGCVGVWYGCIILFLFGVLLWSAAEDDSEKPSPQEDASVGSVAADFFLGHAKARLFHNGHNAIYIHHPGGITKFYLILDHCICITLEYCKMGNPTPFIYRNPHKPRKTRVSSIGRSEQLQETLDPALVAPLVPFYFDSWIFMVKPMVSLLNPKINPVEVQAKLDLSSWMASLPEQLPISQVRMAWAHFLGQDLLCLSCQNPTGPKKAFRTQGISEDLDLQKSSPCRYQFLAPTTLRPFK